MRLFSAKAVAVTLMAFLAGCAQVGPPVPPSLELPRRVSDLRASRRGNEVVLTWTPPVRTTDNQTILHPGPTRICRAAGTAIHTCGTPIGEAEKSKGDEKAGGRTATYVDVLTPGLLQPGAVASYAVEVLNDHERSAGLSNAVTVPLIPIPSPPPDFQGQVTAQGVVLAWKWPEFPAAQAETSYHLRIFRRAEDGGAENSVGDVAMQPGQEPGMLDDLIEWEKTYQYRAAFVAQVSGAGKGLIEVEGDSTPPITVVAHDTFAPSVPSGLQAVFSGIGQKPFIDLTWAPNTDSDLAGYNVYRGEGPGAEKLNAEVVKAPVYRDESVQPGRRYVYSVSAVDLRGNESARSGEASEETGK